MIWMLALWALLAAGLVPLLDRDMKRAVRRRRREYLRGNVRLMRAGIAAMTVGPALAKATRAAADFEAAAALLAFQMNRTGQPVEAALKRLERALNEPIRKDAEGDL